MSKEEFKTIEEIKNEFKDIEKEEIIEMFYNTALKLNKVEKKLNEIKDILYEEEEF